MSFILDALKKSESDRQRNDRPESAFIPAVSPRKSPSRWPWIVGTLLLVNIVVLLFVLLRPAVPPQGEQVASKPPPEIAAQPVAESGQPPPTEPLVTLQNNTPGVVERTPPAARTDTSPFEQPVESARTVSDVPSTETVFYKTFDDVRVEGTLQLPDLHLDIHVYSGTRADRFVFINMKKYRENTTLGEGPRVAEIVPEGVILEYRGTQFLLPRE